ncbi:MAG: carboxypeptidase regulatory-like domain-containing protein [Anaerolineales bacterium]|nr:carboxypeptidase regulatory-like domain-containing protein [Anaerolineales bacterium]
MQHPVRTLFLSICLPVLVLVTLVLPVAAAGGGLVSGKVFLDANRNLQAEPAEIAISGATVHVRSIDRPTNIYTVTADANGDYLVRDLRYGKYEVWVEVSAGYESIMLTTSLGEANGAVALDLPVQEILATPDPAAAPDLFMPALFG